MIYVQSFFNGVQSFRGDVSKFRNLTSAVAFELFFISPTRSDRRYFLFSISVQFFNCNFFSYFFAYSSVRSILSNFLHVFFASFLDLYSRYSALPSQDRRIFKVSRVFTHFFHLNTDFPYDYVGSSKKYHNFPDQRSYKLRPCENWPITSRRTCSPRRCICLRASNKSAEIFFFLCH